MQKIKFLIPLLIIMTLMTGCSRCRPEKKPDITPQQPEQQAVPQIQQVPEAQVVPEPQEIPAPQATPTVQNPPSKPVYKSKAPRVVKRQNSKVQPKLAVPTDGASAPSFETVPETQNQGTIQKVQTVEKVPDRYNAWAWVGVGFLFAGGEFEQYIENITIDYQIGVAKSLWNMTPYDYLYAGLIFDYAYSNDNLDNGYSALYHFSNEQLVLGYEKTLGTKYLSAFLEAGGVFQQRYFVVRNNTTAQALDLSYGTTFGGTFNGGFNFHILPQNNMSYLFRVGMNVMIGGRQSTYLDYNNQTLNVNPLTYSPSISFGVRM